MSWRELYFALFSIAPPPICPSLAAGPLPPSLASSFTFASMFNNVIPDTYKLPELLPWVFLPNCLITYSETIFG